MRWLTCLLGSALAAGAMTPAEYLKAQPAPAFKAGHTLPPLTRYGWTLPLDARLELAERWGYCLEFGGYVTEQVAAKLDDPNSLESQLVALAANDPRTYRLSVICCRDLPRECPPETWARDAEGRFLDGEAKSLDGNVWHPGMKTVYSPAAPESVWREAGRLRAEPLAKVRAKCPIAVVLNGGEYGINVLGFAQKVWQQDPRIVADKGELDWYTYLSRQKGRAETLIAEAVRAAVPDRQLYIYYTATGNPHRRRYGGWNQWTYDYEYMAPISDLPSSEAYWRHFNSGWTGPQDMLTMALNAIGCEIAAGHPLSYNWLCAGWPRDNVNDGGLGDLKRYEGFLKCYYTAGMIGGNAGYYAYPKGGFGTPFEADQPPHWLLQMIVFARVQALFSHLEEFLRQGDLLPGPEVHVWSKDQPAYEFPTGDREARVLARRLKTRPEWLICAWAAGGDDREVKATIPDLGEVTVAARPTGQLYRATIEGGAPRLTPVAEPAD